MTKRRVRVLISGRVQGVFFRAFTRDMAIKNGVFGWVRNLPNGCVEAVFEGDSDKVARAVEWCSQGSPMGSVDKVETREEVYSGEFTSFKITH